MKYGNSMGFFEGYQPLGEWRFFKKAVVSKIL